MQHQANSTKYATIDDAVHALRDMPDGMDHLSILKNLHVMLETLARNEPEHTKHYVEVLEIGFQNGRMDLVELCIRARHSGLSRLKVSTDSTLKLFYLVKISRTSRDDVELSFSPQLGACADLRTQLLWLLWFLPLLDRCMTTENYEIGSTILNQWDAGIVPGLAFCSNSDDHILLPDNVFVPSRAYKHFKKKLADQPVGWRSRSPVCFWRGATTGQTQDSRQGWRSLPRIILTQYASQHGDRYDVALSNIVQISDRDQIAEIRNSGLVRDFVDPWVCQNYKYVVDIDGNTNAWPGLFQKLLSGCVVLKVQSTYRQWYYSRLEPWVNYVPVAADLNDLDRKLRWLISNDDIAQKIGKAGQALAMSMTYESELDYGAAKINLAFRVFRDSTHKLARES